MAQPKGWRKQKNRQQAGRGRGLLADGGRGFFRDGAAHEREEKNQQGRDNGQREEDVEIGQ